MELQKPIVASIIIRTFNEKKHIGRLLKELADQKTSFAFEIIVIDSGSQDGTLDIVRRFNSTKIIEIAPQDFTFGYSLNRGIDAATGHYCAIISAHCHPTNEHWLEHLIKPFFDDKKLALVYGRQQGNELTKYSERQVFAKVFPDTSTVDYQLPFCNNANAAIRRSVWATNHFDEKLTGFEDLDWAKRVKSLGYRIAYESSASVFHIHEESSRQILHRYYREALAYKEIYKHEAFSFFDFLKFFILNVLGDSIHAVRDRVFLNTFLSIINFRFLQFWGTYRGNNHKSPVLHEMRRKLYYPRNPEIFLLPRKTEENQKKANNGFEIFDITKPLNSTLAVWPGSKSFDLQWVKTLENHQVNESHLSFNLHTGTHIDVPYHFIKEGARVKDISLYKMVGESIVLEYLKNGPIDVDFFEKSQLSKKIKKILIKTLNSYDSGTTEHFNDNFVALTPRSAQWLANQNIDLIGVDGPSVQCFHDRDNATHTALLEAGIVILEGLNLSGVQPGRYNLIALPLNIPEAEGAPARAILTRGKLL